MWNNPNILLYKKPNIEKLLQYGFELKSNVYFYTTDIMDNAFCMNVYVTKDGDTEFSVIDKETSEEYALIFNANAAGSFIGSVRAASESVLTNIVEQCYDPDIFKSEQTKLIIRYIKETYGTDAEFLWEKSPNNAIFREGKTKKWFAVLLTVEKRKIGINQDGQIEIINLKEAPEKVSALIDGQRCFRAFHMNKKHWYTVCLDGRVPIDELYEGIDHSYHSIIKK